MLWGDEACPKPATYYLNIVGSLVRLWVDVGLHRGPWKSSSEAEAAVFVGCASATFSPLLGL